MYLIHRADINEYKTVHKEDAELFHEIINNNLFDKEDENGNIIRYPNRLKLITDKAEIKKVLDEKFSSKGRGGDYQDGLPSASVINSLFPLNIDYKDRGSKFSLLKWWNNTSIQDMNAQKVKNKLSTDTGTFIHAVLELTCKDQTRIFIKKRSLDKYINMTCESKEILSIIDNFDNRKQYFIEIAQKSLKKFFDTELEKIYPIANELYFNTGKIQGTIDLINVRDKKLCVSDFKTSKGSVSRNQIIDKHYLNQLLIYSDALYDIGYITKKERKELCYFIYFWCWTSFNSATYQYFEEELEKCRAYNKFILEWYFSAKKK